MEELILKIFIQNIRGFYFIFTVGEKFKFTDNRVNVWTPSHPPPPPPPPPTHTHTPTVFRVVNAHHGLVVSVRNYPIYAAARIKLCLAAVGSARCSAPGLFCTGTLFCWVFCTVTVLLGVLHPDSVLLGFLHQDSVLLGVLHQDFCSVFCPGIRTLFCSVSSIRTVLHHVLARASVLLGILHQETSARSFAP